MLAPAAISHGRIYVIARRALPDAAISHGRIYVIARVLALAAISHGRIYVIARVLAPVAISVMEQVLFVFSCRGLLRYARNDG